MNTGLTAALLLGPGLNNLTERESIFPKDQALSNQYYVQRAISVQQAAMMEDSGGAQQQQQDPIYSEKFLIPAVVVFVSSVFVFSMSMVMMSTSSGSVT